MICPICQSKLKNEKSYINHLEKKHKEEGDCGCDGVKGGAQTTCAHTQQSQALHKRHPAQTLAGSLTQSGRLIGRRGQGDIPRDNFKILIAQLDADGAGDA